jgi:uncharacterized protein YebE (UPF0316 family)
MFLQAALCFAVGVVSDLLVTGYYLCVSRGFSWAAAMVSVPIALMNFWVLDAVLIKGSSWQGAIAYALGNAVGCFAIMTYMKRRKEKR